MQFRILGYFSHFLHVMRQHESHPLRVPSQGCHVHLSRLLTGPGTWAGGANGSEMPAALLGEGAPFVIHTAEPRSYQHPCPGPLGSHPRGLSPDTTCFSTLFPS